MRGKLREKQRRLQPTGSRDSSDCLMKGDRVSLRLLQLVQASVINSGAILELRAKIVCFKSLTPSSPPIRQSRLTKATSSYKTKAESKSFPSSTRKSRSCSRELRIWRLVLQDCCGTRETMRRRADVDRLSLLQGTSNLGCLKSVDLCRLRSVEMKGRRPRKLKFLRRAMMSTWALPLTVIWIMEATSSSLSRQRPKSIASNQTRTSRSQRRLILTAPKTKKSKVVTTMKKMMMPSKRDK